MHDAGDRQSNLVQSERASKPRYALLRNGLRPPETRANAVRAPVVSQFEIKRTLVENPAGKCIFEG